MNAKQILREGIAKMHAREGAADGAAGRVMPEAHTPGPWRISVPATDRSYTVETYDRVPVAFVPPKVQDDGLPTAEPNARLIAAAPDMLAALSTLMASLDWEEKRSGITYNGWEEARAALAKATESEASR